MAEQSCSAIFFMRYALEVRTSLPSADRKLVQIVDAALAETARKSGEWLVCRKGCTQCCFGPFPISQLDAVRLRKGLADLEASDPGRAADVRERAKLAVTRLSPSFPAIPSREFWAKTKMLKPDLPPSPTMSPAPRSIQPQAHVTCTQRVP